MIACGSKALGIPGWCRGKESVVVDLRTPAGRDGLLELAASAEWSSTGSRPGSRSDGASTTTSSSRNPRSVHCSITAFGSTGDYARIKGYEAVVAAKSGLFTAGIYTGRAAGSEPVFVNTPIGSVGAGHLALGGVLAALDGTGDDRPGPTPRDHARPRAHTCRLLRHHALAGPAPPGRRTAVVAAGPSGASARAAVQQGRSLDQHVDDDAAPAAALLAALEIDAPRPASDDRDAVVGYHDAFYDAFRQRTLDEWLPILLADKDIAFEVVRTSEQAMEHPQAVHNGQVVDVIDPVPASSPRSARRLLLGHAIGDRTFGAGTGSTRPLPIAASTPRAGWDGVGPRARRHHHRRVRLLLRHAVRHDARRVVGARVIKVEPLTGDPMRGNYGIPEAGAVKVLEGKESIAVDLKQPEGRAIVERLLAQADVFASASAQGGQQPRPRLRDGAAHQPAPRLPQRQRLRRRRALQRTPAVCGPAAATSGAYYRQAGPGSSPTWRRAPRGRDPLSRGQGATAGRR